MTGDSRQGNSTAKLTANLAEVWMLPVTKADLLDGVRIGAQRVAYTVAAAQTTGVGGDNGVIRLLNTAKKRA
jgi:hypothetical protein